ncbi:MAG: hypothetical protein ABI162_18510 [Luteolibacter sp.]
MELAFTLLAFVALFVVWCAWGTFRKMRSLKQRTAELSPEAAQQMNNFSHAYNKAFALGGNTREAKIYKAAELVVYCTGSPILTMMDASYPLLNQPGHIESKSDAELDELIAELESMPEDFRREMHEQAKTRRPPRDPFASFFDR